MSIKYGATEPLCKTLMTGYVGIWGQLGGGDWAKV